MSSPPPLQLERATNGKLILIQGDKRLTVRVSRCFPWTHPRKWISLRDEEGEEAALIPDPVALPEATRTLLESELEESDHTFVITRILVCRKEIELRCWEVETRQGPRGFQTELDEWPRRFGDGSVLIRDICGDLYTVEDPEALDPESRKKLWVLLD
ncbi:MAG: DUF1854 domain-containing protein [Verrucomicrobia bacterium]|nr:DUF1854 domain-containing protein [Verrucomicrobiota bacterium]MCH8510188.1 DUF1854 domain-containing protein [Kiritimatiellia bacterium]